MSQITIQVNIALSPETLAAMEELAYAMMKALKPITDAALGVTRKAAETPVADSAPAATSIDLGGGADEMLAEPEQAEEATAQSPELMPPTTRWSEERISAMATLKALGESWAEIFEKVNALPGPKIASSSALQVKYSELKRDGKLPVVRAAPEAVGRKVEISVSRLLEEHAGKNADVVPMAWAEICDWAKFNKVNIEGLGQAVALKKINRAREAFGLPLFMVARGLGPVEALPRPELGGAPRGEYIPSPKFKRRAA